MTHKKYREASFWVRGAGMICIQRAGQAYFIQKYSPNIVFQTWYSRWIFYSFTEVILPMSCPIRVSLHNTEAWTVARVLLCGNTEKRVFIVARMHTKIESRHPHRRLLRSLVSLEKYSSRFPSITLCCSRSVLRDCWLAVYKATQPVPPHSSQQRAHVRERILIWGGCATSLANSRCPIRKQHRNKAPPLTRCQIQCHAKTQRALQQAYQNKQIWAKQFRRHFHNFKGVYNPSE